LCNTEFDELYNCAEKIGIKFLQDLRNEVHDDREISRLCLLLKLISCLILRRLKLDKEADSTAINFIKKIYESRLIEEFIATYEENKLLLQKTKDSRVTEGVWALFNFIVSFVSKDSSFLAKERNMGLLKCVIQDSAQIDLKSVNKQCYNSFKTKMTTLFEQETFMNYLKDEKLLFSVLRVYLLSPFVFAWEDDEFIKKLCIFKKKGLMEEKVFLYLFDRLLEVFEEKMKDPSLDFEEALKQFENRVESEKKDYEMKTEQEIEEVNKIHLRLKMESPIINEKASFESLRMVSAIYSQRISAFSITLQKYSSQI